MPNQPTNPAPARQQRPDYYCLDAPYQPRVLPVVTDASHASFAAGLCTGTLTARLKAEQPLLVGSGFAEPDKQNQQYLLFSRLGNRLVIPGSTLKGVVRSYAEALSFSCEPGGCSNGNPCPACAIFGRTDRMGRFGFDDAFFAADIQPKRKTIPQRREPKRPCAGRKFYFYKSPSMQEQQLPNADKEWIEYIEQGTGVECIGRFINLHDWELGLVLLAMGLGEDTLKFSLKMGGAKNRSMGRVKFKNPVLTVTNKTAMLQQRIAGTQVTVTPANIGEYINSYLTRLGNHRIAVEKMIARLGERDGQAGPA